MSAAARVQRESLLLPLKLPPCAHTARLASATAAVQSLHRRTGSHGRQRLDRTVSQQRLEATIMLAEAALACDIPGDFVEAGTFTGGSSVVMLDVLRRQNSTAPHRRHWACDSFQGLPTPTAEDLSGGSACTQRVQAGASSCSTGKRGEYRTSRSIFDRQLARYGFGSPHPALRVIEGWFNETLPAPGMGPIAFLRVDGDLYRSTRDALAALAPLVSPGGFVYVDDYGERRQDLSPRCGDSPTSSLCLQAHSPAPLSRSTSISRCAWVIQPCQQPPSRAYTGTHFAGARRDHQASDSAR